jgi:hypothetical protein
MKGSFDGREYEVVGRAVFTMVEEGVTYTWDEWQLVAADGAVFYLEYDEGRWKRTERFTPAHPLTLGQAALLKPGATVKLDDRAALVSQVSTATVRHVEGEFTYAVRVGDWHHYLDAGQGNRVYSVEWTEEEISFYRGEMLSHRQVYVAFSLYGELAALDAQEQRVASRRWFGVVCLAAGVLAFFGWIEALSPGRVVGQGVAHIQYVPEAGLRHGPFPLNTADRVHRLRISANLRESSAWVGATVEAEDAREMLGVQRDMWDESGYDSDGHWHESDLEAQTDFVPAQAGRYFVRLYAEPDSRSARGGQAQFALYSGVLYPWYLLWYSLLAFLIGTLFLLSGSSVQGSLKESLASD